MEFFFFCAMGFLGKKGLTIESGIIIHLPGPPVESSLTDLAGIYR